MSRGRKKFRIQRKIRREQKKKRKTHRFCILLSLFMLWIGAELSLRVLYQEQLRKRAYPLIYQPHPKFGYAYLPGAEGRICVPSICKDFSINANGYYGPEFDLFKPEGIFRIAIVASSNGTGIWLDGDENYALILQRRFDERGLPVEIINFSVDGTHRDLQQVWLIQDSVIEYKPDLVLLQAPFRLRHAHIYRAVYRDYVLIFAAETGSVVEREQFLSESKAAVDWIEDHHFLILLYDVSYVVRAGVRFFIHHFNVPYEHEIDAFVRKSYYLKKGAEGRILSIADSARVLRYTQRMLKEAGGELLLFNYAPDSVREIGMSSAELSRHFDLPYLQLHVPWIDETRHRHDGHYNSLGHQLIADGLFEGLVQNGYLDVFNLN